MDGNGDMGYFCSRNPEMHGCNIRLLKIRHMKLRRPNSKIFMLLFLGLLSAFGPFVMDMYIPTLPEMTEYFGTSSSMVQLGLTASMAGLAVGQLVFGPLSDRYGRRKPLIIAMVLFLFATAGCIFATSISQFIAMRLVQGLAGSGGVVLSRSIASDKYSAMELATMLGIIGSINGIATVAAPIAGGLTAEIGGWKGIFWCLMLLGALLLAASIRMKESLSGSKMKKNGREAVMEGFRDVLRNRRFMLYITQYGFTMAVLFTNVASAPFIMQEHYGISPMMFSLVFGVNAIAMAIATALAPKFRSMGKALKTSSDCMLSISVVLCGALLLGCSFWVYEILLFLLLSMTGMSFTASNALAMESEHGNAGVASALLGTAGCAFGGIVPPLAGLGNMMVSAGVLFVVFAGISFLCTRIATSEPKGLFRNNDIRTGSLARASKM